MYKAVCRVETVTRSEVGRFTYHNIRKPGDTRTEGMEHIRREDMHKNAVLFGTDQPTRDVKKRIEGIKMARAAKGGEGNDIVAQELILSAHSEFFDSMSEKEITRWQAANLEFLERRFPGNLVSVVVHRDERAPHIHAIVVPIVDSKRKQGEKVLNATEYLGDRGTVLRALKAQGRAHESTLGKLQTEYAEAMQKAGFALERGEENSKDKHQSRTLFRKVEKQYEGGKKVVAELEKKAAALAANVEKLRVMEAQKMDDISKAGAEFLKNKMEWTAHISALEKKGAALEERNNAVAARIKELENQAARLHAEAVNIVERTNANCKKMKEEAEAEVAKMQPAIAELKAEKENLGIECAERRNELANLDQEKSALSERIESLSERIEELAEKEAYLKQRCVELNPPIAMLHITNALEKIGGMDKKTAINETFAYVCMLERSTVKQLCAQLPQTGQKWLSGYDKHKAEQARQAQEAEREAQRQSRSHGRCR